MVFVWVLIIGNTFRSKCLLHIHFFYGQFALPSFSRFISFFKAARSSRLLNVAIGLYYNCWTHLLPLPPNRTLTKCIWVHLPIAAHTPLPPFLRLLLLRPFLAFNFYIWLRRTCLTHVVISISLAISRSDLSVGYCRVIFSYKSTGLLVFTDSTLTPYQELLGKYWEI